MDSPNRQRSFKFTGREFTVADDYSRFINSNDQPLVAGSGSGGPALSPFAVVNGHPGLRYELNDNVTTPCCCRGICLALLLAQVTHGHRQ